MKKNIKALLIALVCTTVVSTKYTWAENSDQMPVASKRPLMTIQTWTFEKAKPGATLEVTLNGDDVPTLVRFESNEPLAVVHDYEDVYAVFFTVENGQLTGSNASEWVKKRACKVNFSLDPGNPSIFARNYSRSSACAPYTVDTELKLKDELVINRIPE